METYTTYPKVPMTLFVTCVLVSDASFGSPKYDTYKYIKPIRNKNLTNIRAYNNKKYTTSSHLVMMIISKEAIPELQICHTEEFFIP